MRSLVTMFLVPAKNIIEQYLLMISLKKLLASFYGLKVRVVELVMEALVSLKPRTPLLVPKMNMDYVSGCICEQVIFSDFSTFLL